MGPAAQAKEQNMAVLTNSLAQKVVDQIENTIPYNINIIDDKGVNLP